MNYINNIPYDSIRLFSREEGKIKSYESCCDFRAWSHDTGRRDDYLREWIRCDVPVSVIPANTLINIVRRMTCCSKSQTTSRCHPQCKSKVVLDSICNSCHAMKECFKNEQGFNKYFVDEEFETSHWPCERYLEALKSIKMFWKIIVEKLFNINVTKSEQLNETNTCCADSVQSVVRVWQTDMVQQAMFVKNITPLLNHNTCSWKSKKCPKKEVNPCKLKICGADDLELQNNAPKSVCSSRAKSCKMTNTSQMLSSSSVEARRAKTQSHSRHTTAKLKMVDIGCECTRLADEITSYKANLDLIKDKFQSQQKEIETLQKENGSLKVELQNVYKNSWWKSCFYSPSNVSSNKNNVQKCIPKAFEPCPCEGNENVECNSIKPIDSEMIITMKNCTNESYRYISLLQVLHKTNAPITKDLTINESCCKKKDPIELLTKVQNTFGAIVKREMGLASDGKCCAKTFDIDATYHKLNARKSEPSCSMTTLTSFDSGFEMRLTQET